MDGTSTFTKIGYESDFGIAKLSPNGSVQWVRTYDHLGPDWQQMLESIACDSSGNVYGCGRAFRYDTGDNFEVVVSYDTNGQIRWVRDSPYPYGSYAAKRIAVDRWDRVIVLGTALTQFDASGAVNWRVLPQRPASELVVDANGDITIAGLQLHGPTWDPEAYVAQFTPDGSLRWQKLVDGASAGSTVSVVDLCLGANGRIAFTGWSGNIATSWQYDWFSVELGDQSQPFCFGDGTATACPCGNASAAGAQAGCLNSSSIGAQLSDAGDASIANDTLALTATDVTGPAFFVQGSAQVAGGVVFGDGFLCLGGTITRLGIVFPAGTTSVYPGGLNPNPIHLGGSTAAGDTRHYQAWYRDAAVFCSAATFNLTQGLTVTWSP